MGLFKINYEKEGPGVSKKEPKKKSFARFFELYYRNFWKLMNVTLYYILLSLPIVTYGLADVGFAHVTRSMAREKHSFGKQDFPWPGILLPPVYKPRWNSHAHQ